MNIKVYDLIKCINLNIDMKNIVLKYITGIVSVILFYNLFWRAEAFDLNFVCYTLFAVVSMVYINRGSYKRKVIREVSIVYLISTIAVLLTGSVYSKIVMILLFLGFVALYNFSNLRTVVFAPIALFFNLTLSAIFGTAESITSLSKIDTGFLKRIKGSWFIYIIPVVILILFVIIFSYANPKFNNLVGVVIEPVIDALDSFFNLFEFGKIALIVFGGFFALMFYFSTSIGSIINIKDRWNLKIAAPKDRSESKVMKGEQKAFMMLAISLNLILLVVNIIDISWVWFGFVTVESELSNFVHEGTYLLIVAIMFTIGIVLFIFRNKHNFTKQGKLLKKIVGIWLIQVLFLIISVAVKNIHYINYYGLTDKRIGVFIFLLITVAITAVVAHKLYKNTTAFYVLSRSAIMTMLIVALSSVVNWDTLIVRYNLESEYTAETDYNYLLSYSGASSHVLYEHIDRFPEHIQSRIVNKCYYFTKRYESKQMFSFNLADYITYRELKKLKEERGDALKIFPVDRLNGEN
jgi:hypothetical protein